MSSNQRQIVEQAKFTYSPLEKAFVKQTIEVPIRKQIDAITNQNKGLAVLMHKDDYKDDHKDIYKEIFEKLVKEKFN